MITKCSKVIGEELKKERLLKKMTLRELADKASVYYGDSISHSSLARYENQGRSIDIDVLQALCKALDLDLGKFLDRCFDLVGDDK